MNTADQLPSRKLDTSYANEHAYRIISYYSIPRTYRGFDSYASYKARDESIWRIGYGSTEIRDKVISGRAKATREDDRTLDGIDEVVSADRSGWHHENVAENGWGKKPLLI